MSKATKTIVESNCNVRRTRLSVLASLCLLASTLAMPLTSGSAHADNPLWQCPFPQPPGGVDPNRTYQVNWYSLVSSTPVFAVADSRVVINDTDSTVSATFTSEHSTTFTLQATVGTTIRLHEFLTANVSVMIVISRTTRLGVSTTGQVPPRSRLIGEYGIEAYNVTYDYTTYQVTWGVTCRAVGVQRATTNAPTTIEGWRLRVG
jgi:hypothetical protein